MFDVIAGGSIDPKNFDPAMLREIDLTPRHNWYIVADSDCTHRCSFCEKTRPQTKQDSVCPGADPVKSHILIPPHSFVLAETLEEFTIPRDVLCIVVGKSTYARCFPADEKVKLLSGHTKTFGQMADKPNVKRWGVGVDVKSGEYKATKLTTPRWIGRENLVEITLDDGKKIRCTPDHEFLRHGGYYTEAQDLRPGDGLVPLYEKEFRGRPSVWIPQLGNWLPLHWLADNWNVTHGVYEPSLGCHRHHKDENKRNNNPTNIERIPKSTHVSRHNAAYYGEGFDADLHSASIRGAIATRMKDPAWVEAYKEVQRAKGKKLWTDPAFAEKRKKITAALRKSWSEDRAKAASARLRKYNATVTFEERADQWPPERRAAQAEVMRRVNKLAGKGNHTVVSVKSVKGTHDVFCLTSEDTGNFALASGVLVKNCGLIVNVTPGEPEWTGKWTVELSNTTPLPLKVYAGEGIMQCCFLRSDGLREALGQAVAGLTDTDIGVSEVYARLMKDLAGGVCRESYATKRGKYQGQSGLTIPKVTE